MFFWNLSDRLYILYLNIFYEGVIILSYFKSAKEYLKEKDVESAKILFREAIKHNEQLEKSLVNLGVCYMLQNDYETAVTHFKEVLKQGIEDISVKQKAFLNLGMCYLNLKNYPLALQMYKTAEAYGENRYSPLYVRRMMREHVKPLCSVPENKEIKTVIFFYHNKGFEVFKYTYVNKEMTEEVLLETVKCKRRGTKKFNTILEQLNIKYNPDNTVIIWF